ncbi:hypothetical protein MQE36_09130 [Zhouia spongiae]|uniref:Uncharacterized protein n=1 Tax=Zhouia spongiae TaxID=2202721 RepID=A0ABY3YH27_9FLAO|nr:hypothetical protein [Zhouia spongiae]UNY97260.1 hypothetical protein MQE36_09130 [Zhouia spongiae]
MSKQPRNKLTRGRAAYLFSDAGLNLDGRIKVTELTKVFCLYPALTNRKDVTIDKKADCIFLDATFYDSEETKYILSISITLTLYYKRTAGNTRQ